MLFLPKSMAGSSSLLDEDSLDEDSLLEIDDEPLDEDDELSCDEEDSSLVEMIMSLSLTG
jgi:hypothetical protein